MDVHWFGLVWFGLLVWFGSLVWFGLQPWHHTTKPHWLSQIEKPSWQTLVCSEKQEKFMGCQHVPHQFLGIERSSLNLTKSDRSIE